MAKNKIINRKMGQSKYDIILDSFIERKIIMCELIINKNIYLISQNLKKRIDKRKENIIIEIINNKIYLEKRI